MKPEITKKDMLILVRDPADLLGLVLTCHCCHHHSGLSAGVLLREGESEEISAVGVVNEDVSPLSGNLIAEVAKLDALDVSELANRDERRNFGRRKIDVLGSSVRAITSWSKSSIRETCSYRSGKLSGAGCEASILKSNPGRFSPAPPSSRATGVAFAVRTIAPDVAASARSPAPVKSF